jgi:hypothetical protein
MRKQPVVAVVLLGALALFAAEVRAQNQMSSPKPQTTLKPGADRVERGGGPGAQAPELRDETFRLMDAYLISNLQESLGLTDEQFVKALPLVKKLQSDRRDSARKRMQSLRLLRKALTSGSATETGVAELLKEVKSTAAFEHEATVRNIEALDAVLTPLQQAKYRVFEAEVDIRMRRLAARSRERGRPAIP